MSEVTVDKGVATAGTIAKIQAHQNTRGGVPALSQCLVEVDTAGDPVKKRSSAIAASQATIGDVTVVLVLAANANRVEARLSIEPIDNTTPCKAWWLGVNTVSPTTGLPVYATQPLILGGYTGPVYMVGDTGAAAFVRVVEIG